MTQPTTPTGGAFRGAAGRPAERDPQEQQSRPVFRDKRRVDESGQLRTPDPDPGAFDPPARTAEDGVEAAPAVGGDGSELARLQALVDERTGDLQRLQAEFTNYRRRVDRDRAAVVEQATGATLAALVPVLDDLDRARAHDEVTGGFATIADALDAAVTKLGLTRFAAVGDPFDPTLHEAVATLPADPAQPGDTPVLADVMRAGFLLGGRLLRPAMVAVREVAAPGEDGGQP